MNRRVRKDATCPPRSSRGLFRALLRPTRPKRAPQPREHVVEDRPLGPGYTLVMCLIIAAVAAAFVFHLGVRFEGVRLGYETNKARALQTRLLLERRELRLELASLKAPARIQSEARDRLGMDVPDHDRIVPIGGGRKVVSVSGGAL